MKIVVVDCGLGNLRSVERALVRAADDAKISAQIAISGDAGEVSKADVIVAPGQGAFRDCARAMDAGMGDAIREGIRKGTPYLGICLGLQVLFGSSEEAPGCAGLGVFEGDVVRLPSEDPRTHESLKIPHTGWNTVDRAWAPSPIPEHPTHFYFVHSYAVRPSDPSIIAATTAYGMPFTCAVAKDNVFAVQFHPEKSQGAGLALLGRYLESVK